MKWLASSLALLALALGGCKVDTLNPITPVENAQADPALYGVWRYTEKGEVAYVHIGPDRVLGDAAGQGGRMRIVVVDHTRNGVSDEHYIAYASQVGRDRYLNVLQSEDGKAVGYLLVRYVKTDGNSLRFATVNEEALKTAIKAGRIAGTSRGDGLSAETSITAPSPAIAAFLGAEGAGLFNKPVLLKRVPAR